MSDTPKRQASNGTRHTALQSISPRTTSGLIILTLLAIAGMSAFSLLNLGGPFGRIFNRTLEGLFGWGVWIFPLYLFLVAALKLQPVARLRTTILGLTIVSLSLLALLDLPFPLDSASRSPLSGEGGGYVGLFLRYPLESVFGYYVAWLLLIALLTAGLLITFDASLEDVVAPLRQAVSSCWRFVYDIVRGLRHRVDRTSVLPRAQPERLPPSEFVSRTLSDRTSSAPLSDRPQAQVALPLNSAASSSAPASVAMSRYRPVHIDLPLSLLTAVSSKPTSGDVRAGKLIIQKTLESFGIPVEMGEVNVGPTVTQYTLKPEDGVKIAAITALHNDLALALAAHPIRIEAPIPGRSLVGIEVPNQAVATVALREILESETFQKRRSNLLLALGKDVAGASWVVDLERMPHLLVAGATGSGKSVCLNAILLSLLYQNDPSDLKLLLVDPKRVEFPAYQHIPHLLTPVITEVPATVNALKWCLKEMDRRFNLLAAAGDRNIQSYNQRVAERLPYVVVVIDELADLMVAAAAEVEGSIIRLAQMARAVGIHLVLATQRPSVDVITGLIKANITARIAFAVASLMDSRTILDTGGAERLVGRGDMLFVSSEVTKPKRVQGAFVGDEEIRKVVDYLKARAAPEYVPEVTKQTASRNGFSSLGGDGDVLLGEAEVVVMQAGKASASLLQRRLKVGYARAARLLDLLEAKGVIGPGDGAKPRDVLIEREARDMLSQTSSDDDTMTEEDYE